MKTDVIKTAIEESLPADENIDQYIDSGILSGNRVAIATTSKRLIICKKGIFKKSYKDYLWIRFQNVILEEGLRKSSIQLALAGDDKLLIKNLDKDEARKICGFARKIITVTSIKKISTGRTCPRCKEVVKHLAEVCIHCGYDFKNRQ